MKNILLVFAALLIVSSCKENTNSQPSENAEEEVQLSTAEQIAYAHGYQNWNQVDKIAFTFNVDRGENHFERSWIWEPKSGNVTRIMAQDSLNFNHRTPDSLSMAADAQFINDKYWLLAPFNLLWDAENSKLTEKTAVAAPISGDTLDMLTITYNNEGGYTPGDAYDFYYSKDFELKEWVFRKSNADSASMTTTWEDYQKFGPLNLARSHKDSLQGLNLHFTGIKVN